MDKRKWRHFLNEKLHRQTKKERERTFGGFSYLRKVSYSRICPVTRKNSQRACVYSIFIVVTKNKMNTQCLLHTQNMGKCNNKKHKQ